MKEVGRKNILDELADAKHGRDSEMPSPAMIRIAELHNRIAEGRAALEALGAEMAAALEKAAAGLEAEFSDERRVADRLELGAMRLRAGTAEGRICTLELRLRDRDRRNTERLAERDLVAADLRAQLAQIASARDAHYGAAVRLAEEVHALKRQADARFRVGAEYVRDDEPDTLTLGDLVGVGGDVRRLERQAAAPAVVIGNDGEHEATHREQPDDDDPELPNLDQPDAAFHRFIRSRPTHACRMSVDGQPIALPLVEESGPALGDFVTRAVRGEPGTVALRLTGDETSEALKYHAAVDAYSATIDVPSRETAKSMVFAAAALEPGSRLFFESGPADVLLLSSVHGQTVTLDIDGVKHVIGCKSLRVVNVNVNVNVTPNPATST